MIEFSWFYLVLLVCLLSSLTADAAKSATLLVWLFLHDLFHNIKKLMNLWNLSKCDSFNHMINLLFLLYSFASIWFLSQVDLCRLLFIFSHACSVWRNCTHLCIISSSRTSKHSYDIITHVNRFLLNTSFSISLL